jgi:hypothetical protein
MRHLEGRAEAAAPQSLAWYRTAVIAKVQHSRYRMALADERNAETTKRPSGVVLGWPPEMPNSIRVDSHPQLLRKRKACQRTGRVKGDLRWYVHVSLEGEPVPLVSDARYGALGVDLQQGERVLAAPRGTRGALPPRRQRQRGAGVEPALPHP